MMKTQTTMTVSGKSGHCWKCSLLQFRHKVIHGLLEKYATERKSFKGGRPSKTDPPAHLTERHFPTHIPPTAKKKFPSRVCQVCPGRKETRWECKQCGTSHYIRKAALKFFIPKESIRICLYNIAQIM